MDSVTSPTRFPKCLGFYDTKAKVKNLPAEDGDFAICFETQTTREMID